VKVLVAPLLMIVALQGCNAHACMDVGGRTGIGVNIPSSLYVKTGDVRFEVCDGDDCGKATQHLSRLPDGPVGRGADVSFEALGRRFEAGQVQVTVKLTDADGQLVAVAHRDIELKRSYPNGKACDGEGYLGGWFNLTRRDRVGR
jgi:hypothetical protein